MRRLIPALMLGLLGWACGGEKTVMEMEESVTAIAFDDRGVPVDGITIAWSSSDEGLVTVSQAGVVTASGPNGTATITAALGFVRDEAIILVAAGPLGGTVSEEEGRVTLDIPAGALATTIQISVDAVASPLPSSALVPGTAYDLGPDGTQFTEPVQLSLSYDPSALPEGVQEQFLKIGTVQGEAWVALEGSTVDAEANTVTAPITGSACTASSAAAACSSCCRTSSPDHPRRSPSSSKSNWTTAPRWRHSPSPISSCSRMVTGSTPTKVTGPSIRIPARSCRR